MLSSPTLFENRNLLHFEERSTINYTFFILMLNIYIYCISLLSYYVNVIYINSLFFSSQEVVQLIENHVL
jgi:hypothetical protein